MVRISSAVRAHSFAFGAELSLDTIGTLLDLVDEKLHTFSLELEEFKALMAEEQNREL